MGERDEICDFANVPGQGVDVLTTYCTPCVVFAAIRVMERFLRVESLVEEASRAADGQENMPEQSTGKCQCCFEALSKMHSELASPGRVEYGEKEVTNERQGKEEMKARLKPGYYY